jgi:signal transduction histidine kinase
MKLTKKLETEILKSYNAYWNSYFKGDMKSFATHLDDDCHIIGSTEFDVFKNKKSAIEFYSKTADQITGKADFINRKISLMLSGENVMVEEFCDFYFLTNDEWKFYGHCRLSTLFSEKESGWKIIYQHGSMPDSKAQEGEQIAAKEVAEENKKLRNAIKRRTVELETKNRELEIEASLERVRAVAMGMMKPDDLLEVSKVQFNELKQLGFTEMRNTLIGIFHDDKNYFTDYDFSDFSGGSSTNIPYNKNVLIDRSLQQMKSATDAFTEFIVEGKELEEWKAFRKQNGEYDDARITDKLYYYFYSISTGNVGLSTFKKISDEQLIILKRFRNVFELAYTRYLDIEQAMAQAREAQIEASLERVRAQAMAMHQQEDLLNICETCYKEFNVLGFDGLRNAMINIYNDEQKTFVNYDYSDVIGKSINHLTYNIQPEIEKQIKQVRKANDAFSEIVFKGKGLENMKKFRKQIGEKDDPRIKNCKVLYYYFYSIGTGAIGISTFNPVTEEKLELLKRFRNVFTLFYQRYTDIALAEAQAREAEIELALERVRARTMAMQKSEEISETTHLLFEQLKGLDPTAAQLSIGIIKEEKGVFELSATVHGTSLLKTYDVPLDEPFIIKKAVKAWKQKKKTFTIELKGNELTAYNNWRNNVLKKKIVFPEKQWIVNIVFFSKGLISFSSDKEISKEAFQLLERFAGVFDGTYTRFLDLKKAEAQAKEARIETALERVRAVAMAMKKSDEVINVCEVMYKELQSLGFTNIRNAQIALKNDSRQSYSISVYSDNESVIFGEAHYHSSPIVKDLYQELEQSKDAFYQREFSGKKFNDWRKWREGLSPFADSREASAASMCFYLYSIGIGHIGISTFNAITEIQIEMLKRFKNVFELCYTRYIDVAKAEVQAREAQIELALERVRARTMAMQHSEELADTATLLFLQFKNLELLPNPARVFFNLIDEKSASAEIWTSREDGGLRPGSHRVSLKVNKHLKNVFAKWKAKKAIYIAELKGKELIEHLNYLSSIPNLSEDKSLRQLMLSPPEKLVFTEAIFKHGTIGIISADSILPESINTLIRFSVVFEQTYTRFLDLQKAEAQSREAQIELALERVRARTMAMQKSDESADAAALLFQQVRKLGIETYTSGFNIWNEGDNTLTSWMSNPTGVMNPPFIMPVDEYDQHKRFYEAWKNNIQFIEDDLSGKKLIDHYKFLRSSPLLEKAFATAEKAGIKTPDRQVHNAVFFSYGYVLFVTLEPNPQNHDVFKRFGKVFEQTYTRFLDLQKAEAQAREAEIELSLERVRARSLAMHKSDELLQVANVLFQQLRSFGGDLWGSGIALCKTKSDDDEFFFVNENGTLPKVSIPHTKDPTHKKLYEGWKNKELLITETKNGKALKEHYDYMLSVPSIKGFFQEMLDAGLAFPNWQRWYAAYFSNGYLLLITTSPYAEEQLLVRFAKVFQQAYTRFLDLQKAEAQAREAEIELALERVRARTMAMQKSEELLEASDTMFDELHKLNVDTIRVGIGTIDLSKMVVEIWSRFQKSKHIENKIRGVVPANVSLVFDNMIKAKKEKKPYTVLTLLDDNVKKHYKSLSKYLSYLSQTKYNKQESFYSFFFTEGALNVVSHQLLSDDECKIMLRFAKVFGQMYTRFLDLQKAETQAREAQIELSLERVRAKTMAMHNSLDVGNTIVTMFDELVKLDVQTDRCGILIGDESQYMEVWTAKSNPNGEATLIIGTLDMVMHPMLQGMNSAWKNKESVYTYELIGEDLKDYYRAINNTNYYPIQFDIASLPFKQIHTDFFFPDGALFAFTPGLLSSDAKKIFNRFAGVFSSTYRRYLDLQKAEAQARQAKIEAAMEKVRARAMSMQKPNELVEVAEVLRTEMGLLGVEELETSSLYIHDESTQKTECWYALQKENKLVSDYMDINLNDTEVGRKMLKFYHSNKKQISIPMQAGARKEWINYCAEHSKVLVGFYGDNIPDRTYHLYKFSNGYMGAASPGDISAESWDLLQRATSVFSLAYTRFSDLQKAGAQAREAQIEASLERVRSRSMGMQKSEELKEVIKIVYQQLTHLKIKLDHAGFVIDYTPNGDWHFWIADEQDIPSKITHPYFESVWANQFNEAKEKGADFFATNLNFEEKNKFYKELLSYVPGLPDASKDFYLTCPGLAATTVLFDNVSLYIENFSGTPYSDEENKILMRFGKVFQQTYTRFLDLQKAEKQARENQIQLALERARAQSMVMQHSNELDDTLRVFHEQVLLLSINSAFSFLWLPDEEKSNHIFWAAWEEHKNDSTAFKSKAITYPLDRNEPATAQCLVDWRSDKPVHSYAVKPAEVDNYFAAWAELLDGVEKLKPEFFRDGLYYVEAFMKYGCFGVMLENDLSEEEKNNLYRFSVEFERTYTRFLDLQKAEAQAREAQIESGLERVRSRTMAMQRSDELSGTAALLFQEFNKLEQQELLQITIGIYDEAKNEVEFRATDWEGHGEKIDRPAYGSMEEPTVINPAITAWRAQAKSLVIDLTGHKLERWVDYRNKMTGTTISSKDAGGRRVISIAFFSKGHLSLSSPLPLPAETVKTLERFAAVFDGTYTRFLDLQKVEAQAREARIETGLEKVRSRTLAMQKSDELADTSIVIFEQLINLGIEPNRLFIGIINKETAAIEAWATNEDGTKIGNHFTLNTNRNESVKKMYEGWKNKKTSITIDMMGTELQNYFHYLADEMKIPFKGGLSQKRRVQTIAYFGQGLIGMASPDEQPEATTQLLERFAAVFNLTYTRFNDLKIAEAHALQAEQDLIEIKAAKQSAEKALTELQSTQKQLIQSEKMASLGELTAGIAHEIQNPLNFVNNFSEVSKELLDEMKDALEKGDTEEAKEIMQDVIQNLEKINHHGKRADSIVKGMLQHSQSSTGKKEPTDINALCDEYLRLSYHGLRAKDKFFNATMKTDFDNSIGNINIIPQDIGRVVLNLINNAFYVVDEKKKSPQPPEGGIEFEPTVTISTKRLSSPSGAAGLLISVSDNGNGIPQKVLDKIFQPFFTTKPTGQGTGLGLSLSYDIIKAHGGEIKVKTKEGEGAEFTIQLPFIP